MKLSAMQVDSALIETPNFWSGGTRRTERLKALSERVEISSIPSDAHALAAGAEELRRQAERLHPITFATDFNEALRTFQLRKTVFECEDAALAWQTASDQYHAAIDVARKVGVGAADIAGLEEAAARCGAQTARLVVKASLLTAITQFKRDWQAFATGNLRVVEAVLKPLNTAL